MTVSIVSCGTPDNNSDDTTNSGESDAPATENVKADAEKYDGIFKVGFSRVNITPSQLPHPRKDGTMISDVLDPIYATCIAVNDGEQTALLYTVDLPNIAADTYSAYLLRIKIMTKVPVENIMISATHNHSSFTPQAPRGNAQAEKWNTELTNHLVNAANEAIADLTDSEIYYGTAKTTGMAWVRRYINSDGTMSSVNPTNKSVKCVSEADDTVLALRFVREGKKDVVIVNWQAHPAHAISAMPTSISADFVRYVREGVEGTDDDAPVAYFSGALGNINLNPPNRSMRKYKDFIEVGKALVKVVVDISKTDKMEKLEVGNVKTTTEKYDAPMKKDDAAVVAAAQKNFDAGNPTKEEKYIVARNKEDTIKMYLGCVSFGDIAFIAVPYEMFDNNGIQIREGSPFKTTFIMTNADGDHAYMPSREAWEEYGGYETEATLFGSGTVELLVEEYVRILKSHK